MGTTAAYFTTEEQLKAKNWDMLQEAKALQNRKVALENEWSKFASSWVKLGRAGSSFTVRFDEKNVNVLNPSQKMCVVETVPQAHFDLEAMRRLCFDLEETRAALGVLQVQLRDLGVTLS